MALPMNHSTLEEDTCREFLTWLLDTYELAQWDGNYIVPLTVVTPEKILESYFNERQDAAEQASMREIGPITDPHIIAEGDRDR